MVRSSKKHGFTLVELLVVIGIIAVLISILLPSLARARQAAVTLKCLSNLKTVGQALMLYADNNKGVFPAGDDGANVYWYTALTSMMSGTPNAAWDSSTNRAMTYFRCDEVNIEQFATWVPASHYAGHPLMFPSWWGTACLGGAKPPNYKQVWLAKNGSEKAIIFDATVQAAGGNAGWVFPGAGNIDNDQLWWGDMLIEYPGAWQSWVAADYMSQTAGLNGVFADKPGNRAGGGDMDTMRVRHNGNSACNFLFGDGHAETRRVNRTNGSFDTGTTDLNHGNFAINLPVAGLRRAP